MKMSSFIISFLFCLILAACSDKHENHFVEVDSTNNETNIKKPALEAEVKVDGNSALIYVNTTMEISKKMYGKKKKDGQGHIHMYVDNGEKQAITVSPVRLENLTKGNHKVKISLHNNDHTPYDVTETISFIIN